MTRVFDFTADLGDFQSKLAQQSSDGGGDEPEALDLGFVAEQVGDPRWFVGREDAPAVAPTRPLYCSLRGPHYHDYPAPQAPGYQVQNDVVFYVGPLDPDYSRVRPQIEQAYDVEYRPYVAQRPQVTVTPPSGWAGEIWVVPPPAPAVQVVAPAAPRVQVRDIKPQRFGRVKPPTRFGRPTPKVATPPMKQARV